MAQPKTKVEYWRKRKFLSQKDVAQDLGMSQQYYCRLEKKPEKFSLGHAELLRIILGLEHIDDLIGEVV